MMKNAAGTSLAAAVVALAVAAGAQAGVSRSATAQLRCSPIKGTPWVAPYAPHPKGDMYDVSVSQKGWTCAKADAYILKLVANKVVGALPTRAVGGPAGWYCTGSKSESGRAYTGSCVQKFGDFTGGFGWSVG